MDARWLALGVVGASLLAGRGGSLLRRAPAGVNPSRIPHVIITGVVGQSSSDSCYFTVLSELTGLKPYEYSGIYVQKKDDLQQWDQIVGVAERVRRGEQISAPVHLEEVARRDGQVCMILKARVDTDGGPVDFDFKRFVEPDATWMSAKLSGYFMGGRWEVGDVPFIPLRGSPLRKSQGGSLLRRAPARSAIKWDAAGVGHELVSDTFVRIHVPGNIVALSRDYLSREERVDGVDKNKLLLLLVASFPDGNRARLRIVNGDPPFVDMSMTMIMTGGDILDHDTFDSNILGRYEFNYVEEDNNEKTYVVEVVEA